MMTNTNTARVIFEAETDTIRQMPQNYCLMFRRCGQWHIDIDAASTINAHSLRLVIDATATREGRRLAKAIDEAFFG